MTGLLTRRRQGIINVSSLSHYMWDPHVMQQKITHTSLIHGICSPASMAYVGMNCIYFVSIIYLDVFHLLCQLIRTDFPQETSHALYYLV